MFFCFYFYNSWSIHKLAYIYNNNSFNVLHLHLHFPENKTTAKAFLNNLFQNVAKQTTQSIWQFCKIQLYYKKKSGKVVQFWGFFMRKRTGITKGGSAASVMLDIYALNIYMMYMICLPSVSRFFTIALFFIQKVDVQQKEKKKKRWYFCVGQCTIYTPYVLKACKPPFPFFFSFRTRFFSLNLSESKNRSKSVMNEMYREKV